MTEKQQIAVADRIIFGALKVMEGEGIPFPMMMDRLLTAAAAHIARNEGAEATARVFRQLAENVEAGRLAAVERRGTTQ